MNQNDRLTEMVRARVPLALKRRVLRVAKLGMSDEAQIVRDALLLFLESREKVKPAVTEGRFN